MGSKNVVCMDFLPKNVKIIKERFISNAIWFNLTPNLKAESCADAANKRNRLGHTGIPIFDELKSNAGYYIDKNNKKQYVIIHCRGNQKLDICVNGKNEKNIFNKKVNRILDSKYYRLDRNRLEEKINLKYGLINPFLDINEKVLHIFDSTVFKTYHAPYTMMTNAGDFNWGIEFHPKDILKVIKNYKIEDVITEGSKPNYKNHIIGILTGNGPESGIMLWKKINERVRKKIKKQNFRGDLSFPRVLIESVPEMGLSMELDLRANTTRKVVLDSVKNLCERGATLICLACNTTQYFKSEIISICKIYGVQFISIPDVVEKYLHKNKIVHFDFLGIKFVTDFKKWSAFKILNNKNYKIVVPSVTNLNKIQEIAFKVKRENANESGRQKLRDIINEVSQTKTIIIALTEISILLGSEKKKSINGRTYIDTLSILADEVAKKYVNGVFKTLYGKPN